VASNVNDLGAKLRFLRAMLARPRAVGAVAPSSFALARAVAAQIDLSRPGPILELGPGTGALTRGVLARGVAPERMTLVEYDPELAQKLKEQFRGMLVIQGDAFALDKTLGAHFTRPYIATISGIPLLNYTPEVRLALLNSMFDKMEPGAPVIQFTYGLHSPISPSAGIVVERTAFVLWNIPPAHVWVYRRR
jgi:phosphatidylethanolamine/phosphatidyl-N-methylethanolamine N-methyltransferase